MPGGRACRGPTRPRRRTSPRFAHRRAHKRPSLVTAEGLCTCMLLLYMWQGKEREGGRVWLVQGLSPRVDTGPPKP